MLNHLEALTALPAPAPALGPGRGAELHSCGQTGHQECPHQPPRQPLHRQRGALGFRHLVAPGSGEAGGGAGDDAVPPLDPAAVAAMLRRAAFAPSPRGDSLDGYCNDVCKSAVLKRGVRVCVKPVLEAAPVGPRTPLQCAPTVNICYRAHGRHICTVAVSLSLSLSLSFFLSVSVSVSVCLSRFAGSDTTKRWCAAPCPSSMRRQRTATGPPCAPRRRRLGRRRGQMLRWRRRLWERRRRRRGRLRRQPRSRRPPRPPRRFRLPRVPRAEN